MLATASFPHSRRFNRSQFHSLDVGQPIMGQGRLPITAKHPSDAELSAFAVGRLSSVGLARVEQHLVECDRCAAIVANSPPDAFEASLRAAERMRPTVKGPIGRAVGPAVAKTSKEIPQSLANHERYRVIQWLAEGGMGSVFLAEHRLLRTSVAIKTIKSVRAKQQKSVDRFFQEAKTAAQLDHANVARVWDVERTGDDVLLVMEYVPGKTLAQIVIKKGPMPVDEACHCITQAALGLEHAANRGVVHRDIKPQNLMLMAPNGTLKILDFGLGRLIDEERSRGRLTTDEDVLGTPHFIAPEQIRDSRAADVRSDIYSLGCTFYYLLAGESPFRGSNPVELLKKHSTEPAPYIRSLRHDVPVDVANLLNRMLAKEPENRPQKPREIVQDLARFVPATNATNPTSSVAINAKREKTRENSSRQAGLSLQLLRSPVVVLPLVTVLVTLIFLFLF
jgi:eukaryotic-like serine/threonine-protein kinase